MHQHARNVPPHETPVLHRKDPPHPPVSAAQRPPSDPQTKEKDVLTPQGYPYGLRRLPPSRVSPFRPPPGITHKDQNGSAQCRPFCKPHQTKQSHPISSSTRTSSRPTNGRWAPETSGLPRPRWKNGTAEECGASLETHRNPQGNLQSAIIRQANSPQRHYVAPKGLNATTLKLVDQNAFYHDLMEKLSPGMNRATAYRTRLVRDPRASRTGFTEIIRRFLSDQRPAR